MLSSVAQLRQSHTRTRGRVDPKKRGNLAGHFQSFITLKALQRLDKKYSVINFAIRAFFTVNAFTFKKELFSHGGRPFPRAAPREFRYKIRGILPGSDCCLRRNKGQGDQEISTNLFATAASCHGF
jgi:hypothetical protein